MMRLSAPNRRGEAAPLVRAVRPRPDTRTLTTLSPSARRAILPAILCFLFAAPVFAAVTGTVTNQTTGTPQAGATVGLYNLTAQSGPELAEEATTDAQGRFAFKSAPGRDPQLLRTTIDGVTYNRMVSQGPAPTPVTLDVFNASREPGAAKVTKHMILFEPSSGQVAVTETFLLSNQGKTAWNNPQEGTLKFFLPKGAGTPDVKATAPGGMNVDAPVTKTGQPNVFAVDFAIKPGDTRIDIAYTLPYTEGADLAGKVVSQDENTYLIVPNGVTMKAEGLNDLGPEPRTKAHIFGLPADTYKVQLTGTAIAAPAAADSDAGADDAGPRVDQILPRVNSKTIPIMAVALGVLAFGFALLYRTSKPPAASPRGGPRA